MISFFETLLYVLIISSLIAVILYFPVEKAITAHEKREQDKRRQTVKRYYMTMYYNAPSLREAEYWLEKYNKGE